MQIQEVNSITVSKPVFGMAYYGPSKKKVAKKIGLHAANQLEKIKPNIVALSKDNDVKMSLIGEKDFATKGVRITVSDVIKNPLRRFFGLYKKTSTDIRMGISSRRTPLKDIVLARTTELVKNFSKGN